QLADIWWLPMPAIVACLVASAGSLLSRLHGESLRAVSYWISYRRQGALLREVVTQSNEAILTLDTAGHILTANPAAEKLLGAPDHVMAGTSLSAFVPGVALLLPSQAGTSARRELVLQQAGSEPLTLEVVVVRIHVEGEQIVHVRMHDITLQK